MTAAAFAETGFSKRKLSIAPIALAVVYPIGLLLLSAILIAAHGSAAPNGAALPAGVFGSLALAA